MGPHLIQREEERSSETLVMKLFLHALPQQVLADDMQVELPHGRERVEATPEHYPAYRFTVPFTTTGTAGLLADRLYPLHGSLAHVGKER
jgi:hypothetical protein